MIEDMNVRGFSEKTRNDYIRNVGALAAFLGRSPDTAKCRGSGSATESSRPAAFCEWGWPATRRRDHGTIGMSDARSTVLETWRTPVESLRRPVGRDETPSFPQGFGHTQP